MSPIEQTKLSSMKNQIPKAFDQNNLFLPNQNSLPNQTKLISIAHIGKFTQILFCFWC